MFSHYNLKRVAMQDFPLANSNFLAVALYMATTAMVDWIKVLEVCVSNRTTLIVQVRIRLRSPHFEFLNCVEFRPTGFSLA